ncbi:hypothetical protein EJB05_50118 [Eragrostis curvula]|uniref:Uncharacterized protein n=1 Tax=Eragrostis curvula TaxID=38414 RepID=A0A5J9SZ86_9POAL|nr:hypothetical protein EJB05_50118 [Eragrostis curvula]
MTTAPVLDLSSASDALLKFAKDRFVERQPRTTAQSTGLIMVDLVKYYAVFPVLPAFMEWGRKGYFQTQLPVLVVFATEQCYMKLTLLIIHHRILVFEAFGW